MELRIFRNRSCFDRKTQYFKITIWSIALHSGIAIALAGFNPYCYAESAIFGKGDRASKILTASDQIEQLAVIDTLIDYCTASDCLRAALNAKWLRFCSDRES